jgi:protein involved in polysaccharide export with SLBB domain
MTNFSGPLFSFNFTRIIVYDPAPLEQPAAFRTEIHAHPARVNFQTKLVISMKKALLIVTFSLLALAPFRCALGQDGSTTPAVRVVEKSSPAGGSNSSSATVAASNKAIAPVAASNEPGPSIRESNRATTSTKSADSETAMPTTSVTGAANSSSASNKAAGNDDSALTDTYKVGVGDVLDVRFLNSPFNRSTLYSVIEGGFIDYPMAGGPIPVAGLTTKDIQARITSELKRLAVEEKTQVAVGVRQYGSHTVIVSGLVGSPGSKNLRREAVPLYVLLAEVQPRLDAGRAAIMRVGVPTQVVDLSEATALNFIVRPGDVINLTARPQEFYYIGGRIGYPGQKAFQQGITLVQAILAAGGLARDNVVELSREGSDGRLATTRFNLKEIKSGKIQDPRLQPGDRIEVSH